MTLANLRQRFDELIEFGKTLLAFQDSLEYLAKKERWEAQCQAILERAFGKDNIYLRKFQAVLTYGNKEAHITHGISLMEGAKQELDLEDKSDKLEKIRKEIQEEKAEAERRAAVVETKLWGSVIELIDMQREELKRRSHIDQEISSIHNAIEGIIHQQGLSRATGSSKAPITELPKGEKEQMIPLHTTEKIIDDIRYITSQEGEILVELTCPICTEEGKRWISGWQIYGDKEKRLFLRCASCGYDREISVLP
jgi:DNA-directed RNA polymerase subunit M/transcription elongation factor TFIIS